MFNNQALGVETRGSLGRGVEKDVDESVHKNYDIYHDEFYKFKKDNSAIRNYRASDEESLMRDERFIGLFNDVRKIVDKISLAGHDDLVTIGIGSAQSKEGNSTVSILIALVAAAMQNGYHGNAEAANELVVFDKGANKKPVLLIDAQFKKPIIHKKFRINAKPGLGDFLSNGVSYPQIINHISPSLKVITVGENKNLMLANRHIDKFKSLLDYLRPQYNHIFIDIPPLMQDAEALRFSELCDGMILTINTGSTRWEVLHEAKKMLHKIHVPLIGGILNKRKHYIPSWLYNTL